MSTLVITTNSADETVKLGERFGTYLRGGEALQLVSDVGGGKTTFVKGLARGMGSDEPVQSPTFIISALYECANGKRLYHYDFYRLNEPGIMKDQLAESVGDPDAVLVIEWGEIVKDVLSNDTITISIQAVDESQRTFRFDIPNTYQYITNALEKLQ